MQRDPPLLLGVLVAVLTLVGHYWAVPHGKPFQAPTGVVITLLQQPDGTWLMRDADGTLVKVKKVLLDAPHR